MQAYGRIFSIVYNQRWSGFSRQIAPKILDFYSRTHIGKVSKSVLDLGCGTGQLALHFLENEYKVVGIDRSEYMLRYANENTQEYVNSGQARFILGDITNFQLNEKFGLVVSTYDTLNHLSDEKELIRCINCISAVCEGCFIFDLNTRVGLTRWNSIHIDDSDEMLVITRGIYDGHGDRAWTMISGFVKQEDGTYQRFDETAFNTVYDLEKVKKIIIQSGWPNVYFARAQDLAIPIEEPEKEGRVFVVAYK
ncbi:MAG: class I SAM-dependent methyltransferase [Candidatus Aegiribacteria sp.]|nr:class I SAM-dependent methyltransferase [Candidatus Aegiribacteria sp.]